MDNLLTVDEIARLLRCSRRQIDIMRSKDEFPPADLRLGTRLRWREETVIQWMANGGTSAN